MTLAPPDPTLLRWSDAAPLLPGGTAPPSAGPGRGQPVVRAVPRPRRRLRLATVALVAALLAGLAGCGGEDRGEDGGAAEPEVVSPLAECDALAAPPAAGAGAEPANPPSDPAPSADAAPSGDPSPGEAASPGPAATGLPDLALPCFTGGEPFTLAELRGPAVVNLWATWCHPCRQELPVFQRFAEKTAGRVHVVGVVVRDDPAAAASFAADLGITFPALTDPDAQLPAQLGVVGLPATLYVDAEGQLAYRHLAGALDEETLADQAREHLGVVP